MPKSQRNRTFGGFTVISITIKDDEILGPLNELQLSKDINKDDVGHLSDEKYLLYKENILDSLYLQLKESLEDILAEKSKYVKDLKEDWE